MALNIYNMETFFFGYDIVLELIFGIVTLFLANYSMKMYKISRERSARYFSISFFLIATSYLIQSFFNFLIFTELTERFLRFNEIQSFLVLNAMGLFIHILFMIVGLVVLLYMTFKIDKKRPLIILILISLLTIIFSRNQLSIFFLLSSVYLVFISYHFIQNYLIKKNTGTLLVAIAFLLLLFGKVHFFFSVDHVLFYTIGNILELIAYILIIINFYYVRKYEHKKRSP